MDSVPTHTTDEAGHGHAPPEAVHRAAGCFYALVSVLHAPLTQFVDARRAAGPSLSPEEEKQHKSLAKTGVKPKLQFIRDYWATHFCTAVPQTVVMDLSTVVQVQTQAFYSAKTKYASFARGIAAVERVLVAVEADESARQQAHAICELLGVQETDEGGDVLQENLDQATATTQEREELKNPPQQKIATSSAGENDNPITQCLAFQSLSEALEKPKMDTQDGYEGQAATRIAPRVVDMELLKCKATVLECAEEWGRAAKMSKAEFERRGQNMDPHELGCPVEQSSKPTEQTSIVATTATPENPSTSDLRDYSSLSSVSSRLEKIETIQQQPARRKALEQYAEHLMAACRNHNGTTNHGTEAIRVLSMALDLAASKPQRLRVLSLRSEWYLHCGQRELAYQDVTAAVQPCKTASTAIVTRLANVCVALEQWDLAVQAYDMIIPSLSRDGRQLQEARANTLWLAEKRAAMQEGAVPFRGGIAVGDPEHGGVTVVAAALPCDPERAMHVEDDKPGESELASRLKVIEAIPSETKRRKALLRHAQQLMLTNSWVPNGKVEAIRVLSMALALSMSKKKRCAVLMLRSQWHFSRGAREAAYQDAMAARLHVQPDNAAVVKRLANLFAHQEQWKPASELCQLGLTMHPADVQLIAGWNRARDELTKPPAPTMAKLPQACPVGSTTTNQDKERQEVNALTPSSFTERRALDRDVDVGAPTIADTRPLVQENTLSTHEVHDELDRDTLSRGAAVVVASDSHVLPESTAARTCMEMLEEKPLGVDESYTCRVSITKAKKLMAERALGFHDPDDLTLFDQAIRLLSEALLQAAATGKQRCKILVLRSLCFQNRGRLDAACGDAVAALSAHTQLKKSMAMALATLLADCGKWMEAATACDRGLVMAPQDADLWKKKTMALEMAERANTPSMPIPGSDGRQKNVVVGDVGASRSVTEETTHSASVDVIASDSRSGDDGIEAVGGAVDRLTIETHPLELNCSVSDASVLAVKPSLPITPKRDSKELRTAKSCIETQDFDDAIYWIDRELVRTKKKPQTHAHLYVLRAQCQFELKQYASAYEDAQKAMAIDKSTVDAFRWASAALVQLERLSEAHAVCQLGRKLDPTHDALKMLEKEICRKALVASAARKAAARTASVVTEETSVKRDQCASNTPTAESKELFAARGCMDSRNFERAIYWIDQELAKRSAPHSDAVPFLLRAQCQLELKQDTALLQLGRLSEAHAACHAGRKIDYKNEPLQELERVISRAALAASKQRTETRKSQRVGPPPIQAVRAAPLVPPSRPLVIESNSATTSAVAQHPSTTFSTATSKDKTALKMRHVEEAKRILTTLARLNGSRLEQAQADVIRLVTRALDLTTSPQQHCKMLTLRSECFLEFGQRDRASEDALAAVKPVKMKKLPAIRLANALLALKCYPEAAAAYGMALRRLPNDEQLLALQKSALDQAVQQNRSGDGNDGTA